MQKVRLVSVMIGGCLAVSQAQALEVAVHRTGKDGSGEKLGIIKLSDHQGGLLLEPDVQGLEPGAHGFHVHHATSCEPEALEGSGHFDPDGTDSHGGPYGNGHLGDLPILYVRADGRVHDAVLAPRLNTDAVRGRTVVIHAGGDSYADEPEANGGGGQGVACGVIPK